MVAFRATYKQMSQSTTTMLGNAANLNGSVIGGKFDILPFPIDPHTGGGGAEWDEFWDQASEITDLGLEIASQRKACRGVSPL